MKKALQPSVTEVKLTFTVPDGVNVLQSPNKIPPVFNGDKLVLYGILKGGKATTGTATLSGNILGRPVEHVLEFTMTGGGESDTSVPVIHQLAAKGLIRDWGDEGDKRKDEIIKMSKDSGVVSSYTAYVAVDEEQDKPIAEALKTWDLTAVSSSSDYIQLKKMKKLGFSGGHKRGGGGSSSDYFSSSDYVQGGGVASGGGIQFLSSMSAMPRLRSLPAASMMKCAAPRSKALGMPEFPIEDRLRSVRSAAIGSSDDDSDDEWGVAAAQVKRKGKPSGMSQSVGSSGLSQLISLQAAEGFWLLNDSLASLTGVSLAELKSLCPVGIGENEWATVIALVLLEKRFNSQRDEWELVAMKAEMWLQAQPLASTLDALKAIASQKIK